MNEQFAQIGLSLITRSLTNPRKTFNLPRLQELADSIKASGVHTPVLVRFLPGARAPDTDRGVVYELVAGERRLRACEMAGLETIPAMIRALTDDQVLEIQLVENLQRDDLTELEEAEGYETLMEHSGINADQVGTKIGKSRTYVYNRLKLLELSLECKDAMRSGFIDSSRALLIARIPNAGLQTKALQEAMAKDYRGEVMSVRALQAWLQANVMLRLDNASFKITDARLVEAAGSCKECPKRTGANPDLFADVSSADICTDPICFHSKEDTHRNALIARAAKKGMRFVEGAEAKELIAHQYTQRIDGYTPLSQVREDITSDGKTGLTMRELLGDEAPGAVLIENPFSKELVEAVPTDEAEAVLLAKGLLATPKSKGTGQTVKQLEQQISHLQGRFEREQQTAIDTAIDVATTEAVLACSDDAAKKLLGSDFLRAWLLYLMDENHASFMARALGYTFQEGEDETDVLIQHIRASSYATLSRAVALCVVLEESRYNSDDTQLVRTHLTTLLDIPVKAISAKAIRTIKDEFADQVKALQAQINAQKPSVPTTPLPQPEHAGGQELKKPKAQGAKAPAPRAPKKQMSAEEAISGIAAAIQGEERATTASPEAQQNEQPDGDAPLPGRIMGEKMAALQVTKLQATVAKYRGPNGETWSGRGLKPRWLLAYIEQGDVLESFLVQPEQPAVDPLYEQALALITVEQKASKRLFKEHLKIGQAKALQLLDQLEQAGKVSAIDATGGRKVLVAS